MNNRIIGVAIGLGSDLMPALSRSACSHEPELIDLLDNTAFKSRTHSWRFKSSGVMNEAKPQTHKPLPH